MARTLGSAWVNISPTGFSQFGVQARAGIKKVLAGASATVPVNASTIRATTDLDKLKLRLAEFSKTVADAKIGVDDKQALATLAKMSVGLDRLSRKTASPRITLEGIASAEADLLGFEATLDRVSKKSATPRASSGGAGFSLLGAAGAGGAALAVSGGLGILPALAAAGLGLGAFGALAMPTLHKVSGAMTQLQADTTAYSRATTAAARNTALQHIKSDWAALTPGQTAAVKGIQGLEKEFGKLATALAPDVLKVFNAGLRVANDLLPFLLPLAQAAAGALGGLLARFDGFAKSAGFRTFMAQMTQMAGPAITTIGLALGKIVIGLGKFLAGLASPGGMAVFAGVADALAAALTGLGTGFAWVTKHVSPAVLHDIGAAILAIYGAVKLWGIVQAVLDSELLANPVGLIVVGLVAAAAAFIIAWKASSIFRDVMKDIGKVMLEVGIIVLVANKAIVGSFLNMVSVILRGAADAFGWVPGLGAKLRSASTMFDNFKSGVSGDFDKMIAKLRDWQGALDVSKNKANTATAVIAGDFGRQLIATNASQRGVLNLATAIGQLRGKTVSVGVFASGGGGMTFTEKVASSISSGGFSLHSLAAGGLVRMGSGPRADDVPAMLSRGELVVPAHLVPSVRPALGGKIPGFASGGIAGMTPWAAGAEAGFAQSVAADMLRRESAHLRATVAAAARAAAASAAGSIGNYHPGAGVQQWRGVTQQALGLAGANVAQLTDAVLYQMSTESGGDVYAVNRTDSNWIAGHPSVGLLPHAGHRRYVCPVCRPFSQHRAVRLRGVRESPSEHFLGRQVRPGGVRSWPANGVRRYRHGARLRGRRAGDVVR
jgi:hypothetical protein